jgi:predicted nucleotidyltransferase
MINFKSQITQKLLGYYFINAHKKHYVNELARILDLDPGNLSRKLKQLENEGILASEFSGKQRYYFLNPKYSLLSEVKKIYEATYGLAPKLTSILKEFKGIKEAYIFGSYAKGKFDAFSDIDLLVIGDYSSVELQRKINDLQSELGREINAIDMDNKEFEQRKKNNDPFLGDILKNKYIKLI